MRTTAVLLAFVGATQALAQTAPLDLKGVRPGHTLAEARQAVRGVFLDCELKNTPLPFCHAVVGFGEKTGELIIDLDASGNNVEVVGVRFDHAEFRTVRLAFIEKYGPPTKTDNNKVSNRMGAMFESATLAWVVGLDTLELVERAANIDKSFVMVTNADILKVRNARTKELAKETAKKL